MKKTLFLSLTAAIVTFSGLPGLTDGLVFDAVDYPVSVAAANSSYTTTSTPVPTVAKTSNSVSVNSSIKTPDDSGQGSLQNAIYQIESAQVELRDKLVEFKAKYSETDNNYRVIKEQRKAQMRDVKNTEKKIKELERTKDKIRKSFQQQ